MSEFNTEEKLQVSAKETILQDLKFSDPKDVQLIPAEESELEKQAEEFADKLLSFDPSTQKEKPIQAVETMGLETQQKSARHLRLLDQPVKKMAAAGDEGGAVAKSLIDLKMQVEALDPAQFNFEAGWFSRTLGYLPFVGTPVKRYFSKFESSQAIIAAVVESLKNGQAELNRDNITLLEDQKKMRALTHSLEKTIRLGQLLDQKIDYKLQREIDTSDPRHKFVQEELLFPLRQRIMDLQQQLVVNQQGFMAVEIIMRNNKELIRGVDRALNVTVSALQVGATVAMALANQKIVLDKLDAVNATTNELLKGTSERLRTQGVEIQKRAGETNLDMEILKQAFVEVKGAFEDISTFRQKALPKMAETILELDQLSKEAEVEIKKIEEGHQAQSDLQIEVLN